MRHRNSSKHRGAMVVIPLTDEGAPTDTANLDNQALEIVLRLRITLQCSLALDDEEAADDG